METQNVEQRKAIGNVGILDLRKATEASVAHIRQIGNVGSVLHSRETAALIAQLNIGNVGHTMQVSPDAKLLTGQVVFSRDYFKGQETPLDLVVAGLVVVEPDVSPEDIERGLGELSVLGQLVCPEHLLGAIQPKLQHLAGQSVTYTPSGQLTLGRLILDANTLAALEDGSELVLIGSLRLPQVLPDDLLEQKIARLQVTGSITCHQENLQTILARLADKSLKVKAIPAGFELVERPLILDNDLLDSLPARSLYCTDRVQVASDVDPSLLDDRLEALISEDMLICPAALRSIIARKCNPLQTRVIFYEGDLWLVDDELHLRPSRFDYLEGQATLVVHGELTIDPQLDPKVLADRLAKVHNLGVIRCTPEQLGAIQARLGLSEGELEDSTRAETPEGGMGNVGYLAL